MQQPSERAAAAAAAALLSLLFCSSAALSLCICVCERARRFTSFLFVFSLCSGGGGGGACSISLLGINFDLYYELKYFKAPAGSFQNNINHFGNYAGQIRHRHLFCSAPHAGRGIGRKGLLMRAQKSLGDPLSL
jgi:hypothetical protein